MVKTKAKRLLSLLLSLAMVMSLIVTPAHAITGAVEGSEVTDTDSSTNELYSTSGSVASITSGGTTTNYPTLAEAVAAISSGGTIKLLADVDLAETITISKSQTVTLDLQGYNITNSTTSGYIDCAGKLTVQDTSADADGTMTNSSANQIIKVSGTTNTYGVTIKSGTIHNTKSSTGCCAIYLSSKAYVKVTGGTVSTQASYGSAIYNNGTATVTVSGGSVLTGTTTYQKAIYNASSGTVTVTGGLVQSGGCCCYGIYNYGSGTVNVQSSGTVSAVTTTGSLTPCYGIYNYKAGKINISGGTVSATGLGGRAVQNVSTGTVTISGGTVSASGSNRYAVYASGSGTVTISSNATVTGSSSAYVVYATAGKVNITGGVISSDTSSRYVVTAAGGTVTISGGYLENNKGTSVVTCSSGSLSLTGGYYYGTNLGTVQTQVDTYAKVGYDAVQVTDVTGANYTEYVTLEEVPTFTITYGDSSYLLEVDDVEGSDMTQAKTDENDFGIPSSYLYGGLYKDADFEDAYTIDDEVNVLSFEPEEDGTYYVRLVSDSYFQVKCLYSCNTDGVITNYWPVIGVDGVKYSSLGILIDGEEYPLEDFSDSSTNDENAGGSVDGSQSGEDVTIYSFITVTYSGASSLTVTCKDSFDVDGYLAVYQGLDSDAISAYAGKNFTIQPYYYTEDGVRVTGTCKRTVTFSDDLTTSTVSNETVESEVTKNAVAPTMLLSVASSYSLRPSTEEETTEDETTYTITKYDGDAVNTQVIAAGETDFTVDYAAMEGYLFSGWYLDADYTTAADFSEITGDMTVYAKYVSADYLQMKYISVTQQSKVAIMRTIAAVDSKNYAEIGFVYEYGDTTSVVKVTKYSSSISGYTAKKLYGGDVVSGAKLFYNDFKVTSLDDGTEITVTPYWVTLDGTTVYGTSRTVTYTGDALEG